jgi:class 3 adenylate cyclase/TolB-like protein
VPSENTEQRKLAAIMFTDMVGYSALAQRHEALALELLEEHRGVLRGLFPKHQGTEIKTTGDGFLVEFASALAAVRCAVEIQQALAERNQAQPAERQVRIRIGIHLGDVVRSTGDVHGDGVNIAARIEPLAEPGGICISNSVYDQIENKVEHPLVRLSRPELKNIQASVQVYKLVLDGARPVASAAPNRRRRAIALGVVVLLVAGLLLMLKFGARPKSAALATNALPSATAQKSIAVLPFVSLSADKADEYLSDGMTEELLNVLAQVPGLRVPGRSSSFAFKGRTEEGIFRKVGEQLHVNTVLEGSVRKAGDKLRITAQLINVADGFHLWSQTYDRDMKDILAVQTEVAQQVVQALQVRLGVEAARALAKTPTENPEAHRLYLLGRYQFAKATQAGWSNAIQAFNQAIQLDPSYALAYCGLADNYGFLGGSFMPGKEALARQKEASQKAVSLDPNLAEAHLSLALALGGDFDGAGMEREMKRALELNPNLALAHDQYAWLLTMRERFDEAAARSKRAVDLDPLSPLMNVNRGYWLYLARRFDEANVHFRKTLELDPNYPWALRTMGWSLLWKGDQTAALALMEKAQSLDADPWSIGCFGYALAVSGDRAKAGQILRDLEDLAKRRYVTPSARIIVHLGLGENEKALDWLGKCYEDVDPQCWYLKLEPFYDSLRREPRFQALLKKVGLDP